MAKRKIDVIRALGGPINDVEDALLEGIRARNVYGTWIRASDGTIAQPFMSAGQEEEHERTRQRFMSQIEATFSVPPSFVTGDVAA